MADIRVSDRALSPRLLVCLVRTGRKAVRRRRPALDRRPAGGGTGPLTNAVERSRAAACDGGSARPRRPGGAIPQPPPRLWRSGAAGHPSGQPTVSWPTAGTEEPWTARHAACDTARALWWAPPRLEGRLTSTG